MQLQNPRVHTHSHLRAKGLGELTTPKSPNQKPKRKRESKPCEPGPRAILTATEQPPLTPRSVTRTTGKRKQEPQLGTETEGSAGNKARNEPRATPRPQQARATAKAPNPTADTKTPTGTAKQTKNHGNSTLLACGIFIFWVTLHAVLRHTSLTTSTNNNRGKE